MKKTRLEAILEMEREAPPALVALIDQLTVGMRDTFQKEGMTLDTQGYRLVGLVGNVLLLAGINEQFDDPQAPVEQQNALLAVATLLRMVGGTAGQKP